MTMVPAQNLSKQQHLLLHQYHNYNLEGSYTANYGGGCGGNINDLYTTERFGGNTTFIMSRKSTQGHDYCSTTDQSSCVGSDILVVGDRHQYPLLMADDQQDESRTNSLNNDAASTNSNKELIEGTADEDNQEIRDRDDDHEGWLQLSIGGLTGIRQQNKTTYHHPHPHPHPHPHEVLEPTAAARRAELNTIELDLLPGGGGGGGGGGIRSMLEGPSISTTRHQQIGRGSSTMSNYGSGTNFSTTSLMYFQHYYPGGSSATTSNFPHHHQEALNNWPFGPVIPQQYYRASSSSSTSSSSLLMPVLQPQLGSAATTSYLPRQFHLHPPMVDAAAASAGPTVDFTVVNPPRRPHSGIWFMLQASQNQAKEPFLPQISKSFLRIKDGRMTVRLLIKYLVNKLRLASESEIEITCRGQLLLPSLTLQHVRDNIWAPALTLLPDSTSSTTDHVMILHYCRSSA